MKRQHRVKRKLPEPPNRRELRRAARAMDPRGNPNRVNKVIVVVAVTVILKCVLHLVARARRQRLESPLGETTDVAGRED